MPRIDWELSKFIGMHTQPSKVEGGEIYAEDMQNLRIDGEGWLCPRSDITDVAIDGENITGVASTQHHLWVLRSDGKLYVRDKDDLTTETEVEGVSGLSGRISVVGTFRDYVILTSEGTDQGYIIDLREDEELRAYPLGFTPPEGENFRVDAIEGEDFDRSDHNLASENLNAALTEDRYYAYAYTYLSFDEDKDPKDPWFGMESNPNTESELVRYSLIFIGQNAQGQVAGAARVQIPYIRVAPMTHLGLYRSAALDGGDLVLNEQGGIIGFKNPPLLMRKIADIDIREMPEEGTVTFFDGLPDSLWSEKAELRRDNNRLPDSVKQVSEYNDLVFGAAGDRLIYSDIRSGVLTPWAFPEVNDIRVEGRVDFCSELREVLLFGGIDGLHRLTGVTEYDFRKGNIGNIGPIDGYAWDKTLDALAFVGEGGLYATDGSTALKLSDVVLDAFFNDKTLERGGVIFFKDNDILFSVDDDQFKMEDKYWTRWTFPFIQSASILQNKRTLVLVADGTGILKEIDWNKTESEEEDLAWQWTSNFLDGAQNHPKLEKTRKRFSEFTFTGSADNELTLKTWVDDDGTDPTLHTFASRPDSLRPVRVPINRRGRRIKFQLSGTGDCKIQGIGLKIIV